MTNNVVPHPKRNAKRERVIIKARKRSLQDAIRCHAYAGFLSATIGLDGTDCEWCDERPKSLVVRWEFAQGGIMTLEDGAEHPEQVIATNFSRPGPQRRQERRRQTQH